LAGIAGWVVRRSAGDGRGRRWSNLDRCNFVSSAVGVPGGGGGGQELLDKCPQTIKGACYIGGSYESGRDRRLDWTHPVTLNRRSIWGKGGRDGEC